MAVALADRRDVAVHIAHDERTAAFIALGIGLATGTPAAVLCTSGTAATHFHAAIVEAALSGVPMLAVTADRPPELQGIGAPQTIDQLNLYGNSVRAFADPGVPDHTDAPRWRTWAAEWWNSATASDPGPVHLNLPFREPLLGHPQELPTERPPTGAVAREYPGFDGAASAQLLSGCRGVIVAGAGVDDAAAVHSLADALQWPIFADPRSDCRGRPLSVASFDALLRCRFAADQRPEVVLHIGEPPASKVLGQWLRACNATHVHLHAQARVIDPLRIVTHRITAPPSVFCRELSSRVRPAEEHWAEVWLAAEQRAQKAISRALGDAPLSEPAVARQLTAHAAQLVVASSMPIRDVEWFGDPAPRARVYSNRGANGIDGVIATAIGVAVGSASETVALLGDIAFCHDQSSLTALAARRLPLTIVVVDNDGGGIFSFLPQAAQLPAERFDLLFGTPHGTDIVAVARAHGLGACTARSGDELAAALLDDTITVVRVPSDRAHNVHVHAAVHAAVAAEIDS